MRDDDDGVRWLFAFEVFSGFTKACVPFSGVTAVVIGHFVI